MKIDCINLRRSYFKNVTFPTELDLVPKKKLKKKYKIYYKKTLYQI